MEAKMPSFPHGVLFSLGSNAHLTLSFQWLSYSELMLQLACSVSAAMSVACQLNSTD